MGRSDMRRRGIEDFPPDTMKYTELLNGISGKHRAASYKISRTESDLALHQKTGADRYQPGQYKVDRTFVEDKTREVRAGALTSNKSPPQWSLSQSDSREDAHGILRGIRNPGNVRNWFNPTGPGQYEERNGLASPARISTASAPSFSVRKGEPAESVREKRLAGSNPGPGHYQVQSRFDVMRQKTEAKQEARRLSKACRWEGQFQHMFRCMGPNMHSSTRRAE